MKKLNKLKLEDCEMKPYMKLKLLRDVRDQFYGQTFMLPFADNFSNDKRFQWCNWNCVGCDGSVRESQCHVTSCDGYRDLLDVHDIQTDDGLVDFYRAVLDRRDEWQEEKG